MSLNEFLALLAVPPGSLAYHLIRLVVLEAGVALAWYHYCIGRAHRDRLTASGLAVALALQFVPLVLSMMHQGELAWTLNALEVLITLAIVWALALIHVEQRWIAQIAPVLVGAALLGILALGPTASETSSIAVNSALFLLGAGLLFGRRERDNWALLVLAFLLLSASPLAPLLTLASRPATGAGRLFGLAGYLVLLVALYQRTAAQWQGERALRSSLEGELQSLTRGALRQSQQHLFLLHVCRAMSASRGLLHVLQTATESLSLGGQADRVAIALVDEREPDRFRVLAVYDPVERQVPKLGHVHFSLLDFPAAQRAATKRRPIVLDKSANAEESIALHALMGTDRIRPLLVQPLVHQETLLGLALLSNLSSNCTFSDDNLEFCAALGKQIAYAIANAHLYRRVALAEEARHADARQLQAVLESIDDGAVVTDHRGQIIRANAAAGRMFELEPDELTGRPLQELCPTLWSDGGPTRGSFQLSERLILAAFTHVYKKDGEPPGFVVLLHDLTQQAAAEQVNSELFATVSHELHASVTAIRRCADLMAGGVGGNLNDSHRDLVEIIRTNVNRIDGVASHMTRVPQVEGHTFSYPQATDIAPIIQDAVNTIRSQLLRRGLSISSHLPDDLPPVNGAAQRLRQVLDDLLSDACKATPSGGHVEVRATTVPAGVIGSRDWGYLAVEVSDTGVGIPAAGLSQLIERFCRGENLSTTEGGTAAIGLTIATELVDLHARHIWVDREAGKGSALILIIPLARQAGGSG